MSKFENLGKIVPNLTTELSVLDAYASDMSFVRRIPPRAVVKPRNGEEVQKIVCWANETHTPLVPISSGAPHFRGDTVPTTGGCVIVDLSDMKKVVRIDAFERVAMVEAGVTFGELIPQLTKEGIRCNMPLLPRATKSVLGSMLEREPVLMPAYHWDASDPLGCVEVIYGTGDIFRTGAAAGPGPLENQWRDGEAQKQGTGPGQADFYRLIQGSQGTMGIVNWGTLRCELLPSIEEPFLVGANKVDDLFEFVHWLIRLRLTTECFILNKANLATILTDKKWPDGYLKLHDSLPNWILFFAVVGYKYFPEERIAWILEHVNTLGQRFRVEPLKVLNRVRAEHVSKLVKQPSAEHYWKLRYKGSSDDIFFLTVYERIPEFLEVMLYTATEFGYPIPDIGIYIQPVVQGTSCHVEFNLPFDPQKTSEVEKMKNLHTVASKNLLSRGAFFARPYGIWSDLVYRHDGHTANALRKVKGIFDPNNIMNPNKLCF